VLIVDSVPAAMNGWTAVLTGSVRVGNDGPRRNRDGDSSS